MTERNLPRENLCRSVLFTPSVRAAADTPDDGLTFTGYGAVFNQPTRIDSWEGCFDEQIAPGAFRKSLRERTPKFQFDHGRHPLIGSVPIGVITDIREDDQGLFVNARLGRHMIIDLIREALATGAIDGMSFRFSVVNDEWRDRSGVVCTPDEVKRILYYGEQPERAPLLRTLKEVRVDEVGPVVWPAYAGTSAAVRSTEPIVIYPDRLHEPEQQKLLAEAVLRFEAATPDEGDSSVDEPRDTTDGVAVKHSERDSEPRDTTEVAVEHSAEDTAAPQPTPSDERAGEHEATPSTETPGEATRQREAAEDRLLESALDEIRQARESTPPLK